MKRYLITAKRTENSVSYNHVISGVNKNDSIESFRKDYTKHIIVDVVLIDKAFELAYSNSNYDANGRRR